jgi:nucleoside-diphosphate-sugar epimerase
MNVLLIGGGGYLGNALTKRFLQDNFRITVVDKMVHGNYNTIIKHPSVRFIEDDIVNIETHINDYQHFERIIYLASPRLQDVKNDTIVENELETLKKTLEITKKYISHDCGFWFMSSCSVYGKALNKVNEDTPPIITSLYAKLKVESEKLIQNEDDRFRILRLSTLYGRGTFDRNDILINSLISDIKQKKKIEIWDPDVYRPHLHLNDAANIITDIIRIHSTEKILNIGFEELNISKRAVMDLIHDVLQVKVDAEYLVVNDSRDYVVDFSKFRNLYKTHTDNEYEFISYEEGIFDLYVGKINFTHEDYDSIIDYYRPNGSSSTWYLKEEGKVSAPKMWGSWNIIDDATGQMMNRASLKSQIFPHFREDNVNYCSRKQIGFDTHIYFMPIFAPSFFEDNRKIGFSCINSKFLDDVRSNRCKIVMYHTLEGYSGETNNIDLEIIQEWIDKDKLPAKNIYYLHGNLKIEEIAKSRGYQYKCIGVSSFDIWLNPNFMPTTPCLFHPHESKYLFLSYNRNQRYHRLLMCSDLLKLNLIEDGLISIGDFEYKEYSTIHPHIKELKKIVPVEIDKSLDINWANDITTSNFENTFLSLVTETHVDNNIMFLSEKIWKPIYMGHPFLVLGNPHTLKKLKEMGYKTFDKWWDESYDNDLSVEVRSHKIANIINLFKDKSVDDLIVIRKEMEETIKHNQDLLRKKVKQKYNIDGKNYVAEIPILKLVADIYYNFI